MRSGGGYLLGLRLTCRLPGVGVLPKHVPPRPDPSPSWPDSINRLASSSSSSSPSVFDANRDFERRREAILRSVRERQVGAEGAAKEDKQRELRYGIVKGIQIGVISSILAIIFAVVLMLCSPEFRQFQRTHSKALTWLVDLVLPAQEDAKKDTVSQKQK